MLRPSDLAPFLAVGDDVQIGSDVRIGAHVTIHDHTVIGDGVEIQDGAVVGKPPKIARIWDDMAAPPPPQPLVLAPGAVVCCNAVVFAGARLGPRAIVGDQAFVRERTLIGERTVVGRGSAVDADVVIGDRVRVQTDCYLTAHSEIEDDVFVGPGVVTTNDSTMARHAPDAAIAGFRLRRACRVGGGVVLCPDVEVGEEAFVAAGAVVTRDIPPRAVAMGIPARVVREVGDGDLLEHWR